MPGNHEGECHSPACILDEALHTALGNFSAYNARFRMPAPESGTMLCVSMCLCEHACVCVLCATLPPEATGLNMWYSFNFGMAHFINIDTEVRFSLLCV